MTGAVLAPEQAHVEAALDRCAGYAAEIGRAHV